MTDYIKITVKAGDTLWSLAAKHLNDPLLWKRLWKENWYVITKAQQCTSRQMKNMNGPDWIFPGTVLKIPSVCHS